ncbi:Fic family protein [Arthrobacter rhombi]|uniref:Fic family protein n=1 Tax=Arthrobacter rhombi TaxID=71253 RepID=UPI003FD4A6A6
MKLPMPAPKYEDLLGEIAREDPQNLNKILLAQVEDDPYLHWDSLRYKNPPEGLSLEDWWLALKLRRTRQGRTVELFQKDGRRFWFSMTDRLLRMSEDIARRAGANLASKDQILRGQTRENYIVRSLVEEAVTSSQLEGASTSRRDAVELLESGRDPRDKSEIMIVNNYLAMQIIKDAPSEPLTPAFVLEMHRVLTDGTLDDPGEAGRLETPGHERVAVWDNEVCVHRPPRAEELPGRLQQLCDFANGGTSDGTYMPPVVRAIILHFMTGYDHYFVDGNGRTARVLFYWSMLREQYWLSEYVTISRILRNAPSRYGATYLYTEDDDGDLTYFIHYQLETFLRALDDLEKYIRAKSQEAAAVRAALAGAGNELGFRQVDMLEKFSRGELESITAQAFANRYRMTDQTARSDLDALVARGYLTKVRSGKAFVWKPTESLARKLVDG